MTTKPRRKPGPKPKIPTQLEGRDYYCGTCVGRRDIPCPECITGCPECFGKGRLKCPQCMGGALPVPPPVW